jgi:hypothetical protein
MYLNTMARYLGDAAPAPEPAVIAITRRRCAPRWRKYRAAHPGQAHAWRLFLAANPSCHKPKVLVPQPMAGLGTIHACNDANSGLLINCWDAALKKGLSGLGTAVSQAQLSKLATAYQRLVSPRRLAGLGKWVFSGNGMAWQPGMGDDSTDAPAWDPSWLDAPSPQTPIVVPPSYVPAPDISTIMASQPPAKQPAWLTNWINTPVLPTVTAQTLIAAAQLPNAPTNVKAAAAQVQASGAGVSSLGSLFTGQMISGIPNYVLMGGGLLVFVMISGKRGRR